MLSRIFGAKKATPVVEPPPCPHTAIVAKWDRAEDMGKKDRISGYVCTSCQREFSREEGAVYAGD